MRGPTACAHHRLCYTQGQISKSAVKRDWTVRQLTEQASFLCHGVDTTAVLLDTTVALGRCWKSTLWIPKEQLSSGFLLGLKGVLAGCPQAVFPPPPPTPVGLPCPSASHPLGLLSPSLPPRVGGGLPSRGAWLIFPSASEGPRLSLGSFHRLGRQQWPGSSYLGRPKWRARATEGRLPVPAAILPAPLRGHQQPSHEY